MELFKFSCVKVSSNYCSEFWRWPCGAHEYDQGQMAQNLELCQFEFPKQVLHVLLQLGKFLINLLAPLWHAYAIHVPVIIPLCQLCLLQLSYC